MKRNLNETPYILPMESGTVPGTKIQYNKAIDLRLERFGFADDLRRYYERAVKSTGIVWRTNSGTWVYVKGGFGAERQLIRVATQDEIDKVPQLPLGFEDNIKVDVMISSEEEEENKEKLSAESIKRKADLILEGKRIEEVF